jgi:hypothetical protein
MKKALVIVLALLIGSTFTMGAFAQATTEPRLDTAPSTAPMRSLAAKAAPKLKSMQYTGTIVLVDATAKGIVVKGRKGEMTFDVSMARWKPYKSMNEVKQGDAVTVRYMEKGGEMVASSVTKANPSGVKEESSPTSSVESKADQKRAPTAPKGGVKEESVPANK